jgi:hypothetical protein
MPRLENIAHWLLIEVERPRPTFQHLLATERDGGRRFILEELRTAVQEAHEDARRRLCRLAATDLDPLANQGVRADEALGYPQRLPIRTLKGYFGEFFAGVVAENCHPFDLRDWVVPAYLFRFHTVAFQQLDAAAQDGNAVGEIPGRTGDDCLAFRMDATTGLISAALFCEAKCTDDHDAHLVAEAHTKLSSRTERPADLLQLIEVLQASNAPDARRWAGALERLFWGQRAPGYARYDQITYICGRSPARGGRTCWISRDGPHEAYRGGRSLHIAEIHLQGVDNLVAGVYGRREE